jgi:hypothetical protein
MSYQDDGSRKRQLFGSLSTEAGHPSGKFLWGWLFFIALY